MKEINLEISLSKARNAEHYQFHSDVLEAITEELATTYRLTPLRTNYRLIYDRENEAYLRSRKYTETEEIGAAHQLRCKYFLHMAHVIDTAVLSLTEATHVVGKRLAAVLDPYRNATRHSYTKCTAEIKDFVEKMQETDNHADAVTLGIADEIDNLGAANKAFNAVYKKRSQEHYAQSNIENMKSVRPELDAAAKELFKAINALYLTNELAAEKDVAMEKALGAVIDEINALIFQLDENLARAGVGKKTKPSSTDKPTTPPDEKPQEGGDKPSEGGDTPTPPPANDEGGETK